MDCWIRVLTDYQPLPTKYRPRTWSDLVGQVHAVAVLKASILNDRIFPAYIFTGTRGSGKTSAARILGMALNCDDLQDASPCLVCPSCLEALKLRHPDIIEMDGPSHGSIAHIRDLKTQALYSPLHKRKIFILDEAHGLTRDAFEALLKLLEEPPSHVTFVLASTAPERIPATIQSRSIKLDFRRHTEDDVLARLDYIATAEHLSLDREAAVLIARYADGSLRDSVTVLDQLATSHPDTPLTPELVTNILGIASGAELRSIMTAVLDRDAKALEAVLLKTLERTTEFGMLVRSITDWYRDVLRAKAGVIESVERPEADHSLLERFAAAYNHQEIEQAIRITWEMADRVKFSSTAPKAFFLTGLYRLMLVSESQPAIASSEPVLPKVAKVETAPEQTAPTIAPPPSPANTSELERKLQELAENT